MAVWIGSRDAHVWWNVGFLPLTELSGDRGGNWDPSCWCACVICFFYLFILMLLYMLLFQCLFCCIWFVVIGVILCWGLLSITVDVVHTQGQHVHQQQLVCMRSSSSNPILHFLKNKLHINSWVSIHDYLIERSSTISWDA